ncbi:MAG: cupredoxin domain-containing protein [Candidatus Limnocylindria bacterium]
MTHPKRRPRIAVAAALAWLVLGVLTALPARGGGHAVQIVDFAFSPATLTIQVGDTVTWTNADVVVHTATAGSGAFDSGDLAQGESYSVTFTEPGTYEYLCTPHPDMTGRIVVAPPTVPASAPPSGGDSLPDVAIPAPGPSALQVAGMSLLVLGGLTAGLIVRRRRTR